MLIYGLLKSLVLLPAILVLGLLAGLLLCLWRRRLGLAVVWLTTAAFYVVSAPITAHHIARWIETVPPLKSLEDARTAQAIVVLSAGASDGGPEYGGIILDGHSILRLRYAAHLQRLIALPVLVSGGPIPDSPTTYAREMRTALEQDFGVPVTWVEDKSLNTDENARFSATILKTAHVQKIVLVTEAGHMPRSVSLFQAQGLEVVPAPTSFTPSPPDLPYKLIPSMTSFHASWFALYEIIGQVWYRIKPAPATANAATLVPPAGRTSAP